MEEWRDIRGYEGEYMVSSHGRVKSMRREIVRNNGRLQTIRERILKPSPDDWGYLMVRVGRKTKKIHSLVASAFLGNRKNGEVIRHL